MKPLTTKEKLKSLCILCAAGTAAFCGICIYKGNEKFYKNFVMPAFHKFDPELAHSFAIKSSKYRLLPKSSFVDPQSLKVNILGKPFSNPIGLAAGLDKHGEGVLGFDDMGFAFVEVGSVTPQPQPGNEKPRIFRLVEDRAIINRFGFNSDGHEKVYERLKAVKNNGRFKGILGINLGKNKTSPDPIEDYVKGVQLFGPIADYLVINISSPNTPGLRDMQIKDNLRKLLEKVVGEKSALSCENKPPILLKLAPDLTDSELQDIASVVKDKRCLIDGFIISNTTVDRPNSLVSDRKTETGGLSGEPLKDKSTKMISKMYKLTGGMPIIGVGGISSGQDAYDKLKAGASAVQIYTAIIYEGPPVVTRIKRELAELLLKDGYKDVSECVGINTK